MATLTVDKAATEAKARVMDAVAEAKQAISQGKHQLEDLRDTATYRARRAPLTSVGIGFGAGILLGAVLGVFAAKLAKR
jgi:ElaB/YqjD/DUF883 family membrane-anchored ribosome-binding protein